MGKRVTVELPNTPTLDRYNTDPRVETIQEFLLWLHNVSDYVIIMGDPDSYETEIEIAYDFIRERIICDALGYNYDALEAERKIETIIRPYIVATLPKE